ncbi:hypothetical protein A0H81_13559 [Grifola frondosa]|uniref:Uncharacterized protein n=1 Tax=Grifola frondosa TaxID=5627 RepID=A0A1C7LR00_GRIFR|nr:hypothetical protein A0H81_13559 [Grifola frondosa]
MRNIVGLASSSIKWSDFDLCPHCRDPVLKYLVTAFCSKFQSAADSAAYEIKLDWIEVKDRVYPSRHLHFSPLKGSLTNGVPVEAIFHLGFGDQRPPFHFPDADVILATSMRYSFMCTSSYCLGVPILPHHVHFTTITHGE